jgi:hypothetical protein
MHNDTRVLSPPQQVVRRNIAVQAYFSTARGPVSTAGKVAQRKAAIQLRPGVDAFPVTLQQKAGGWPLPRDVKSKMEGAFGVDFSDVRIHVGAEAAAIGAVAFTWGSQIHFAPGQYSPHTPNGQYLLGHELAHVVQQRAGRVANPFGSGVAVVQDHALESEADRLGRQAAMHSQRTGDQAAASRGPAQPFRVGGATINRAVRKSGPA